MSRKNIIYALIGGIVSLIFYLITYYNIYDFFLYSWDKSWISNPLFFIIFGSLIGYLISIWNEKKLSKVSNVSFVILLFSILYSIYGAYAKGSCSFINISGSGHSLPSFECVFFVNILTLLYILSILGLILSFLLWLIKKLKSK